MVSGDMKSIPRDVKVGGADRVRVERWVRRHALVRRLFNAFDGLDSYLKME